MKKKFLSLVLMSIMVLCMSSTVALAADNLDAPAISVDESEPAVALNPNHWNPTYTGRGYDVNLTVYNTTGLYFCIRMFDYNDNQVWYQYHSLAPWGESHYFVGANVKRVEMIGSDGVGTGIVEVSVSRA